MYDAEQVALREHLQEVRKELALSCLRLEMLSHSVRLLEEEVNGMRGTFNLIKAFGYVAYLMTFLFAFGLLATTVPALVPSILIVGGMVGFASIMNRVERTFALV